MARLGVLELIPSVIISLWILLPLVASEETILSTILTPKATEDQKDQKLLSRQSRSRYYDPYEPRYGSGRQFLERLVAYERPQCGRCLQDRYDDRDDGRDDYYDRSNRDRYDDDRRVNHKPTYGNRYDRNQNYDRNDDEDRYNDRRGSEKKNGTSEENGDDKKQYDEKDDRRPSGGRRGGSRDREKDRNRNRYDDRDRYRPDYYDRFLRDPERERGRDPYRERDRDPYRERDYYDDYRERRPLYERYPYDRYDEGYGGRYDGYYDNRRPLYDDRGNGYDDRGYGRGRGPHDSFRPWDETYRGQSGWDDGGRGYYFASGRPDAAAVPTWGNRDYYPREYVRPEPAATGWQNVNRQYYNQGVQSYPQTHGYRQDYDDGTRVGSGWQNIRPYRDQSSQIPKRGSYGQQNNQASNTYGQNNNAVSSSSTTPGTSYLYQREDEQVTSKDDVTTNSSA